MAVDLQAVLDRAFIDAGAIYSSDQPKADILAAVAEVVADERERCAQLAEAKSATYCPHCGPVLQAHGGHDLSAPQFADLLRQG